MFFFLLHETGFKNRPGLAGSDWFILDQMHCRSNNQIVLVMSLGPGWTDPTDRVGSGFKLCSYLSKIKSCLKLNKSNYKNTKPRLQYKVNKKSRANSHFCPWMCNSLLNDENTKFSPRKCKKCGKYIWPLIVDENTKFCHRKCKKCNKYMQTLIVDCD